MTPAERRKVGETDIDAAIERPVCDPPSHADREADASQHRGLLTAIDTLARNAARRLTTILRSRRPKIASTSADELLQRAQANLEELEHYAGTTVLVSGHATGPTVDLLIRMAETRALSGRLWIRTDRDLLAFDLEDGKIVGSLDESGSLEGERTGEMLVGMGALDNGRLRHALTVAQHLQVPVGVVLLEEGFVTPEQLQEALRQQCVLRLSRALFAEGAAYALTRFDEDEGARVGMKVSIDPRELITASSQGCPSMSPFEPPEDAGP